MLPVLHCLCDGTRTSFRVPRILHGTTSLQSAADIGRTPGTMKTIQTSYILAATLREALAVTEQAAKAGEEKICQASLVDSPEECSPAKVAAGTAPSHKETRNQRRAKRRKFLAKV
jgi:hypothetical protein